MTTVRSPYHHQMCTRAIAGGALTTRHGGYYVSQAHAAVPHPTVSQHVVSELATQAMPLSTLVSGKMAQRGMGLKRKHGGALYPQSGQAMVNDSSNPYKIPKTKAGALIKG